MSTPNTEMPMTSLLHDLGAAAKNLVLSEVKLLKLQVEAIGDDISRHVKLLVLFACLAILSILPLLASAILALGEYLEGRYWLSSLIVGVVGCVGSTIFVRHSLSKIEKDAKVTEVKVEARAADIKEAIQGV